MAWYEVILEGFTVFRETWDHVLLPSRYKITDVISSPALLCSPDQRQGFVLV